ncbi:MAG: hypothetical protein V4662_26705 [Verrucomicrobiota bacterium]
MSFRLSLRHLILSFSLTAAFAQGQLGVSPSQNAAFLSELRARDKDHAKDGQDALGDHRLLLERGRELSRPEVFKPLGVDAARLESDITGFNSQYQLGRRYFSPFYSGWDAPRPSVQNANGLTLGTALQFDIQNGSYVFDRTPNLVFSPTFLWDGSYKIDENQTFTFTGGLQLNIRGDNEHYDSEYWSDEIGFALLPGTSIAYDLDLDSLHVTAYDRVSARPYVGMLQNDLGLAITLELAQRLSWTVNYTFSKTYDIDGNYGAYSRGINFDQHTISSELVFEQSSALDLGVEGAMTWYDPDNSGEELGVIFAPFRLPENDAMHAEFFNAGLFAAWRPAKETQIRVAAGAQSSRVAGEAGIINLSINPEQSDTTNPYYSLAISQRLSEQWSHELAAGYENVLGLGGYYSRAHYVNYGVTGAVCEGGQFTASVFFERTHSPMFRGPAWDGDSMSTTGLDLHYSQRLSSRLALDFAGSMIYGHTEAGNYFSSSDVYQYLGGVGARYALTDRTQLRLNLQAALFHQSNNYEGQGRLLFGVRTEF